MQKQSNSYECSNGFTMQDDSPRFMERTADENLMKCKKRIEQSHFRRVKTECPAPTRSVVRRNERERNRVRMVNSGFATLRQHVPKGAKNKKMSKVETLKSAVEYIKQLQQLLIQDGSFCSSIKTEPSYDMQEQDEAEFYKNLNHNISESLNNPRDSRGNTYQGENSGDLQSPTYSLTSSPAPSWASENHSSPYSMENPEDEDILTFATWFS